MQLSAGQKLAHYEIVGSLGKGGMGEVYRARDTKLDREVAIKVLPEALVENEEQLARFEREAKLLAALNHPNVATIFGVDHVNGVHFLSLELVPGETLADRIATGALPVTDAIKIAQQIAAGLEAAHATGIVHRDLKPANIIVRPDRSVKILDFGLAKQTGASKSSDQAPVTQAFQVMGTPGYLSPEQARGEETDRRADVWAFGCILYECLAGAKAFPGKDFSECIRMIFEETPDLEVLPLETPPTVRLLVSRCLSKDSSTRLRNIGDVKLLLEGAINEPSTMMSGPLVIEKRVGGMRNRVLTISLAVALVVVGVLAVMLLQGDDGGGATSAGTPTTLGLPFGAELGWRASSANLSKLGLGSPMLAVSPDGQSVAYCVDDGNESWIYIHAAGEFEGRPLPGTERARAPFFSPGGDRVGFLDRDGVLSIVPVDGGGVPDPICKIESPNFSACWTPDGDAIIFSTRAGLQLVRHREQDPEPEPLTAPRDGEVEHCDPAMLPDGEHVLFTVATGTEVHIALLSRTTNEWEVVVKNAASPRYAKGRLLFAQKGAIRTLLFNPSSTDPLAVSQPLQEKVHTTPSSGGGRVVTHYDVTSGGTLAYAPATAKPTTSTAYWVDRDKEGKGTVIHSGEGDWKHARLSPTEDRFAIDILRDTGVKDVYTFALRRDLLTRFTEDGMSIMSAWTPSGSITARSTHRKNELREFKNLGADPVPLPKVEGGTVYADCWSRDGTILIMTVKKGEDSSLWHHVRGQEPKRLLNRQSPRYGQLSPDGKWLAYVAKPDDRYEVYVAPYPEPTEWFPVSKEGGGEPLWSKDGKELFFRRPDGALLVVTFETEPRFSVTRIQELFTNQYDPEPGGHQHYDVTRDGKRFLMIENRRLAPDQIHVVPNALR